MDSRDKLRAIIVISILVFLCTIVGTIGSCSIHRDVMIAEAMKNGVDPIDARLALSDNTSATEIAISILSDCKED